MVRPVLNASMLFKAQNQQAVAYEYVNLRDFGIGPRNTVDDTPYGGGDGMLLKPEPLFAAIEYCRQQDQFAEVLLMTPRGQTFNQSIARELANNQKGKILVCARYEGYDERVTTIVDRQISVGNYVLTGGEIPAMVIIDAITRLLPGVLGGETSAEIESFSDGKTLEYPQYTRPEEYNGIKVPKVLLSGNHAAIKKWRSQNSKEA